MFFLKFTRKAAALIFYCSVVFVAGMLVAGCSKQSDMTPAPPALDSTKQISTFTAAAADGTTFDPAEFSATISADSIQMIIPPLTDKKALKLSFTFKGKSVVPASGTVQDLTLPVIYTVTSDAGSTKQYVVTANYPKATNTLFIGTNDKKLYALDTRTGATKWMYTGNAAFTYSAPIYRDGVLYMGGVDTYVYAFNAMNGRVLWKYKTPATVESDAVVSDSTVYAGCNDKRLYALNAVTGALRWSYSTGGNISSSPKIVNGNVYFGSSDGKLYALNAKTGSLVWSYQTGATINQSAPAITNGIIYVGSRDGSLYAVDALSGTLKWKYTTATTISFEQSSPTVKNGVVYIGGWYNVSGFTLKGSVYAINATTGGLIWEALKNTGFSCNPCVSNNRLFIYGDDGNLSALNTATGATLWQKQVACNGASPVESDGVVYVGSGGEDTIYAFNAATGAVVWSLGMPTGSITSDAVVVNANGDVKHSNDSDQ